MTRESRMMGIMVRKIDRYCQFMPNSGRCRIVVRSASVCRLFLALRYHKEQLCGQIYSRKAKRSLGDRREGGRLFFFFACLFINISLFFSRGASTEKVSRPSITQPGVWPSLIIFSGLTFSQRPKVSIALHPSTSAVA